MEKKVSGEFSILVAKEKKVRVLKNGLVSKNTHTIGTKKQLCMDLDYDVYNRLREWMAKHPKWVTNPRSSSQYFEKMFLWFLERN